MGPPPSLLPIVSALLIFGIMNTLVELVVAIIFVSIAKFENKKRVNFSVLLANIISYPIFILSLKYIYHNPFNLMPYEKYNIFFQSSLVLFEICVVLLEAFIIYYLNKNSLSYKKSFLLSFFTNLVTFIIGYFIPIFILIKYI